MTFCIAWKTQKESYLISDEIVSESSNYCSENKSTIFGESLDLGTGRRVSDGVIKSHFGESYIASLVGSVDEGVEYFEFLLMCIDEYGFSVLKSIESTVSNFGYMSSKSGFEIVVSCYLNDEPRLYVVRASGFSELDVGVYFFGNPSDDFKEYVTECHNNFTSDYLREIYLPDVDEIYFVKILTSVQFYGVHNHTISMGIGGCYVGGWCDSFGVNRQPPILYLMSGENPIYQLKKMVGVIPDGDFVGLIPGCDENLRILTPFNRIGDLDYGKAAFIAESCVHIHDGAGYEYIALLSVVRKSIVVIWTRKKLFHADVIFDLTHSSEGDLAMIISQRALYFLNRLYDSDSSGTCHAFLPYQPASISEVNEFEGRRLDLYLTMGIVDFDLRYRCVISADQERRIFLSEEMLVPFLSDFYDKFKDFIIVDGASDLVVVEVENGDLIFPEELSDFKLLPNLREVGKKFFYWFEFLVPEDEEFNVKDVVVASESYDKAVESATAKVNRVWPGFETDLIYIGEVYYHAIVNSMMSLRSNEERDNV